MKKILYILAMAVATMFTSCQKDVDVVDSSAIDRAVAFSAESIAPLTRVSGTSWNKGDAIGITEINTTDNSVVYDNIKYVAAEDGEIVSFNPDSETIYYSENGAASNFMAYYPYQELWSCEHNSMICDISTQDGSQEEQDKIDLLESVIYNQTEGEQVFQFTHALSMVQITVSNYDEFSAFDDLSALTATIFTKNTQYNILEDEIVASTNSMELKMVETSNDGETAIYTAIIAPVTTNDVITFTDGTTDYHTILSISNITPGMQYNFTATVGDQGLSLIELVNDGEIEWDTQAESAISNDMELVDGIYQIYTAEGLNIFRSIVNGGATSINGKLMNNIDLEGSESDQWSAIGSYDYMYGGTFDGGGFEVSGLYINGSSDYQGLFGYADGAAIYNVSVSGSVTAGAYVGGLVGYADCSIVNCYNKATVSGNSNVGGLVGYADCSIGNCYNKATVSGNSNVGGLVGSNEGSITSCYNSAAVSGESCVGGLVGSNEGSITSCYYDSSLYSGSGIGDGTGDVTGFTTANMQSTRLIYHLNNAAYTYNLESPEIEACAWQQATGEYPIFDLENEATYTQFDIRYDTSSRVYQIFTGNGLRIFRDMINGDEQSVEVVYDNITTEISSYFKFGSTQDYKNATLMNDIDLEGSAENPWTPIGYHVSTTSTSTSSNWPYTGGIFDGGGHTVSGLYVTGYDYKGLFAYISYSTIKNLGVSGTISARENVGGIVGYSTNTSKVTECFSNVDITAGRSTGGIVGWNEATVENCYNMGSVGGMTLIGGVVGYNYSTSYSTSVTVTNCYNAGKVYYSSYSGYTSSSSSRCGVVGSNTSGTYVTNSYCDTSIDGTTSNVVGGSGDTTDVSGLTTDEMTGGTFAATLGSAFVEDSGSINNDYPILIWQVTE